MKTKKEKKIPLTSKEQDTVKSVGMTKMVKNSLKIYNNLCQNCKLKTMRNPKAKKCKKCTDMAKEVWGDLVE